MKKTISIILLLSMMLTLLIACDNGGENEETTPAVENSNEGQAEVETSTEVGPLAPRDLDGYVFRWLGTTVNEGIVYEEDDDVDTSSVKYKAQVERDAEVIDRLNVSFLDVQSGSENSVSSYMITDAMAPYSAFDAAAPHGPENISALISQNIAADVSDIPHLRLDQAWYQQQANKEYNIMGKLYFVASCFPALPGTCPLIFNKDMMLELNLDLPYDTILAGEWTIEKMMEYCSAAYKDLGAAGRDDQDFYGYSGHTRSICYFYQGMAGATTSRDENGAVVPVLSNDKVDALFTKISDFYNQSYCWTNTSLDAGVHSSSHKMFYDGNALFCFWITGTLKYYEIDAFDRGLAILPKYDLDQETYCMPASSGIAIFPANLENADYTGYIFESLCEATWRVVYPATIQEAIDFEQLTDEGSIAVQKLVDQSLTYDILKNCDPSGGLLESCGFIWYCVQNKTTPSAAASSVQAVVERQFHEFFYGKTE